MVRLKKIQCFQRSRARIDKQRIIIVNVFTSFSGNRLFNPFRTRLIKISLVFVIIRTITVIAYDLVFSSNKFKSLRIVLIDTSRDSANSKVDSCSVCWSSSKISFDVFQYWQVSFSWLLPPEGHLDPWIYLTSCSFKHSYLSLLYWNNHWLLKENHIKNKRSYKRVFMDADTH